MKTKALGLFLLAVMGAIAGAYFYFHSVPQLAYPLRSIDGWALSDGGSMALEVVDADGQAVFLGITAVGLEVPADQYPAFIGRSILGIPISVSAAVGSALEMKIANLASEIAGNGLTSSQLASVDQGEFGGVGEAEQRYVVAWAIYRELEMRHLQGGETR